MGNSIIDWEIFMAHADAGAKIIYYVGHLAIDRVRMVPDELKAGWYREERIEPLATLGDIVYEAYENGLVFLTQRRSGSRFLYEATRSSKDC